VNDSGPFLITGCYRTGSEYVTQLLSNHPNLRSTMYTVNFMRFCYGRYDPLENIQNVKSLLDEVRGRLRTRWKRGFDSKVILHQCAGKRISYGLLYDLIMRELYCKDVNTQWAEKTQLVWTKIPDFLEMFPNGKAIHVIRDPRSVLASFKRYTYAPEPAYTGAIFNCLGSMQAALQYDEAFPDKHIIVRYEDLARKPEPGVKELFGRMGYSADHDLLRSDEWVHATGEKWDHNSAFDLGRDGFNVEESITRWKKHLNNAEITISEWICGPIMLKYGYELSNGSVGFSECEVLLKSMLKDNQIASFLERWATDGKGVEQFPTDPLSPSNWEEVVLESQNPFEQNSTRAGA